MNHLQEIASNIREACGPIKSHGDEREPLYLALALLCEAKGVRTSMDDAYNAWVMWATMAEPEARLSIAVDGEPMDVYRDAVVRVASDRMPDRDESLEVVRNGSHGIWFLLRSDEMATAFESAEDSEMSPDAIYADHLEGQLFGMGIQVVDAEMADSIESRAVNLRDWASEYSRPSETKPFTVGDLGRMLQDISGRVGRMEKHLSASDQAANGRPGITRSITMSAWAWSLVLIQLAKIDTDPRISSTIVDAIKGIEAENVVIPFPPDAIEAVYRAATMAEVAFYIA
jgi:hypothetical protein